MIPVSETRNSDWHERDVMLWILLQQIDPIQTPLPPTTTQQILFISRPPEEAHLRSTCYEYDTTAFASRVLSIDNSTISISRSLPPPSPAVAITQLHGFATISSFSCCSCSTAPPCRYYVLLLLVTNHDSPRTKCTRRSGPLAPAHSAADLTNAHFSRIRFLYLTAPVLNPYSACNQFTVKPIQSSASISIHSNLQHPL